MRNPESDALSLLGIAMRAGFVVCGVDAVRRVLEQGGGELVVTASDASAVQLKKLDAARARRGVPTLSVGSGARLGAALGRGPVSAVAVTRRPLAERIANCLREPAGREPAVGNAANPE